MFTKIEFVADTKRISCLQVKKDEEQCWLGYCIEMKSCKKNWGAIISVCSSRLPSTGCMETIWEYGVMEGMFRLVE